MMPKKIFCKKLPCNIENFNVFFKDNDDGKSTLS